MWSDEHVRGWCQVPELRSGAHLDGMTYPMLSAQQAQFVNISACKRMALPSIVAIAMSRRRLACVRQLGERNSTDDAFFQVRECRTAGIS